MRGQRLRRKKTKDSCHPKKAMVKMSGRTCWRDPGARQILRARVTNQADQRQ